MNSRFDNIHGDEHLTSDFTPGREHIEYNINIRWSSSRREYIATFDGYDGAIDGNNTIGVGDRADVAAIDLIENATRDELRI